MQKIPTEQIFAPYVFRIILKLNNKCILRSALLLLTVTAVAVDFLSRFLSQNRKNATLRIF